MKEALTSSETSVLTRATRRIIPGDAILYSHRRENLKFYTNIFYTLFRFWIIMQFLFHYFQLVNQYCQADENVMWSVGFQYTLIPLTLVMSVSTRKLEKQ
jgi:hypothetical protein